MQNVDERYYVSYRNLRQSIGFLGLIMPFVVRLGAIYFENNYSVQSISAYYYTGMRDVLVGTLVLIGVLLACYRTPEKQDTFIGLTAGLAAIGMALFPTDPANAHLCYVIKSFLGFHEAFAGIFFGAIFYLVYFRFRAMTPQVPTPEKIMRNRIYKASGLVMLFAFIAIGLLNKFANGASIFWPETAAVVAFGIAWLVKGQRFFADKHSE